MQQVWGSLTITLQVWGSLTIHYMFHLSHHCEVYSYIMDVWLTHIYITSMRLTLKLPLWGLLTITL